MTDPNTIPDYVPPTAVADPAPAVTATPTPAPLFDPYTGERLAPPAPAVTTPVQDAAQALVGDIKGGVSALTSEVKDDAKVAFADLVKFSRIATEEHGRNLVAALHALVDAL